MTGLISELKAVTVSVSHLRQSVAFYRHTFGYEQVAEGEVAGDAAERAWRMPAGTLAQCAVLGAPGASTGLLRLVQFAEPGSRIWGDYSRAQDYGHFALNIRVDDVPAAIARLTEAGGQARSGPTRWTVTPQIAATDSLSFDPDGILLDVFELTTTPESPLGDLHGTASELQTLAMHVSDARRSAAFYSGLGYTVLYDKMLADMESFFRLPPGTALHNINMYMPGEPARGRVELAQYVGFPGRDQRARAVPPHVGILSATMRTGDLEAAMRLVCELGGTLAGESASVDLPPFGPVLAQPFFGPDGEAYELVQPL